MKELFLSSILAFSLLIVAAGIGKKCLYFLLKTSILTEQEMFIFAIPLGSILMSLLLFFLGIFHLYYASLLFSLLIFCMILFYKEIYWAGKQVYALFHEFLELRKKSLLSFCCVFFLFLFIFANFFFSFTPEIQWDSLVYHLTVPKIYAQHHGLIEIPYDYHTYLPKQFDILFIFGEVFSLPQTSRIFTMLFDLFLALTVYVFCKKYWNAKIGLLAATLLYTIPVFTVYQSTTYNDTAMAIFLFCSFFAFILSIQEQRLLFLVGIFLGACAATKILALAFLLYFSLLILWKNFFTEQMNIQNKEYIREKSKKCILSILLITLCTFFVLAPWLTLSYVQTKNPVYPFFYTTFGGSHWSIELDTFWNNLRESYGIGRTASGFFLTPWLLTMQPMLYGPVYGYSPIFLLFLPLFFWIRKENSFQNIICNLLWTFILFYFILWFFLASDGRYLLPSLAAATILVAVTLKNMLEKKNLAILCTSILIIILFSNLLFFAVMQRNTIPVLIGTKQKDNYIQEYLQNYAMAQWVNQNLKKESLLFIANDDRTYFYDVPYIQGYPIIQGVIDYPRMKGADELYKFLKQKKVTHIVITIHQLANGTTTFTTFENYYNNKISSIWQNLTEQHGELIIEKNNVSIYLLN